MQLGNPQRAPMPVEIFSQQVDLLGQRLLIDCVG